MSTTFASTSSSTAWARPEEARVADAVPFCPYVGLRPFNEADRPYFFGREKEIRTIADNLYGARLTILYGASGVGKSSVLMAGLVPELRKEARTAVVLFRRWQVPEAVRLLKHQVIEAVSNAAGKSLAIDEQLPLDELLKQAADALDGTVLLLLDQFEEYFLYFSDPGVEGGFDAELARAITRREVDAGFLVSMREDALSSLDRFRKRIPTLFGNTQRLSHLWVGAANLAVVKPLEVYNARHPDGIALPVAIEPALVQSLLEQVSAGQVSIAQAGGAGQTAAQADETRVEAPYLQLVLERLWGEEVGSGSRVLKLSTLKTLGGAQNIVRTHLDQVMERLDARDQRLCARVFDRLVTPAGAKVACRLGDLGYWAEDLASEVPRVTKLLEDNRLLARIPAPPGRRNEDDQYQIFHDVLAPGILDWRSRFLQREEKLQAETAAAEKEREAAEERLRLEGEAARERDLRLAKERAEQERRSRRRFQVAMIAFFIAAASAFWFGIDARKQTKRAEQQTEMAESDAKTAKRAQATLQLEKIRDHYAKARDYDTTIESLDRVLQLDPGLASADESLGRVYYDRGIAYGGPADIDRAIAAFDAALKLDPKQVEALAGRAVALQYKGEAARALADYDAAIALATQEAQRLAQGIGSRRDSPDLRASISAQNVTLTQLYYNRATLHESTGRRAEAIADYSKALELQPELDDALLARGELYRQTDRLADARADFQRALHFADDERSRALAWTRLAQLGAAPPSATAVGAGTTVFLQIVDPLDKAAADSVQRELERKGFRVAGIETVPTSRTNGDVRYASADQRRIADTVARAVETTLAREGQKLTLQPFQLDPKRFPNAKPDVIEVWLPSLSGNAQRPMPKY
ncbi:tetratricopeptide repeat protein [Variovorax sp. J22P240]|uniref:tetratricopeptide repeat protein n=1 Tax=Variovorax sp. J22P240 TaxID=3053514 RepID=UPI0025769BCB|nr:tetratricopeptide repeat protein [Variovorax sp. J22P240]MDM0002800.1 tetratricopeptide repeat protein [Variovorax sp. J22P240]